MRTHVVPYNKNQPDEEEAGLIVARLARVALELITTISSPSPHSGGSLSPKVSRDLPWVMSRKRMSYVLITRLL